MTTEYRTARWPEREFVKTQTRPGALERLSKFMADERQARMRFKGRTVFGAWRHPSFIQARVEDRLKTMPVGEVIIVQRETDREQLAIRKMEKDVVADLGCHPMLEVAHAYLWEKYDVRSGGRWYCRFIDGTWTVSRHGFWQSGPSGWRGAAEDVFVNEGGMEQQEEMADDTVQTFKGDGLLEVISNRRIWTPSRGWHPYGGHPHYHEHLAFMGGVACRP
jgi:hypothetical protein